MAETRTLLLTDIVDSTKLSEELGDAAMAGLWAAHDRVARDLLVVHNGKEIDKTDGFLLLFDEPSHAMAYAAAYHRAIGELDPPIKARAGLHVGRVILTKNSAADISRGAKPLEVDGIAKPTAARVMSIAIGGQTLLTHPAREALGETAFRVESHGHWRMKGVAEPIELFEVGDADAPFTPPPDGAKVYRVLERGELWLPVSEVKHSLPAERDAFVGRTADLQTLTSLLTDSRLVSVLGMGGTGKTRLVTRFGWIWLGDYPGGVWFCDLSEARSVDGIVSAVARALDVPLGKDDHVVQLGHAIAGRGPCLIVLDNFEQVARHARETLSPWLDRAGEARFVVTTREVIGLPGETALPLAPLVSDESFDLFAARAKQAKPSFSPDDTESIRSLVTLLDGLPLAIELAAARVRLMPPKTLLERMGQRFKLLASKGGRHTRQATLRGALDWSWDLLSADEQSALAQLSVFEGGFTLDAAEGALELEELWPMDAVQGLVDKSLIRQVSHQWSDSVRMDLLVSVQEYAAEKLRASGAVDAAEARHADYYAQFGTLEALEALDMHGGTAARQTLRQELDNLVVGCRRSVASGTAEPAVALLQAAWVVLNMTGPFAAGTDLAQRVVAMPDLPCEARAVVERVGGQALRDAGRSAEARVHFKKALALNRELGDRRAEGKALNSLGSLHSSQGRMDEAKADYDGALAIHREVGNRSGEGYVLGNLGSLHLSRGQGDEAKAHYEAALAVSREVGFRRLEGKVLGNLGILHLHQGRMDEARDLYDGALAINREVGDRRSEAIVLINLGGLHSQQGRMDEARDDYREALAINRELGSRNGEGFVLGCLGGLNMKRGRMDGARAHFYDALAIQREVGNRRHEGVELGNLGTLHQLQGRMDEARADYDGALAIHREVGNRKGEGFVLGNLGVLQMDQGRMDEARTHFDGALAISRELGNRRLEGRMHGSLGDLHRNQGRMDEARAHLDDALAISREVGDPTLEGIVLGYLGNLHLVQGRSREARSHLEEGEDLLRNVDDLGELAEVLSGRARLEAHEGDHEAARSALAEAQDLAKSVGAVPGTGLGKRLSEAELEIEALERGGSEPET